MQQSNLEILETDQAEVNHQNHEVIVSVLKEADIPTITIRHYPAFQHDGIHVALSLELRHADLTVATTSSSSKYCTIELKRPLCPRVVNEEGLEFSPTTQESQLVRVWCTIPLKTLPVKTALRLRLANSTPELEDVQDFLARRSETSSISLSDLTVTTSNTGNTSASVDPGLREDRDAEPEMWLDLRMGSEANMEADESINHHGSLTHNKSHMRYQSKRRGRRTRPFTRITRHPARSQQSEEADQLRSWSEYARVTSSRQSANPGNFVSHFDLHKSRVSREIEWHPDLQERYQTNPEPMNSQHVVEWQGSEALPFHTEKSSYVMPSTLTDNLRAQASLVHIEAFADQFHQTSLESMDDNTTRHTERRSADRINTAVPPTYKHILSPESAETCPTLRPHRFTQRPLPEVRALKAKKLRGGAMFDSV